MDNSLKKTIIYILLLLVTFLFVKKLVCSPPAGNEKNNSKKTQKSTHQSSGSVYHDGLDENFDPYSDAADNVIGFEKDSFVFTNFVDETDAQRAIVKSIALAPKEVMGGNWVRIKIETTIESSKIKHMAARLASPSYLAGTGGQSMYRSLRAKSGSRTWLGAFAVRRFHEAGQWQVNTIYIKLVSGAYYSYNINGDVSEANYTIGTFVNAVESALPIHPGVKVLETAKDKIPPIISDILITPGSLNGPGKVRIRVDAADDESGISSISAYMHSPTLMSTGQGQKMFLYFSYNQRSETWQDNRVIHDFHESGDWKIVSIVACDRANNCNLYKLKKSVSETFYTVGYSSKQEQSNLSIAALSVSGTNGDTEPPVLNSVFVSPSYVYGTGIVTITLDITETGSGIKYARATLASPTLRESRQGQDVYVAFEYNPNSNTWTGGAELKSGFEKGMWKVSYISVQDIAGNKNEYIINKKISQFNYTGVSGFNSEDSGIAIAPGVQKH